MTVADDGEVHVDRVVAVVDCGQVVNPNTVEAQIQSGIIFGITAALWGEITLKNGRVEQTNFDDYKMLRIDQAPKIEVEIVKKRRGPWRHRRARHVGVWRRRCSTRFMRRPACGCARCRSTRSCCARRDD